MNRKDSVDLSIVSDTQKTKEFYEKKFKNDYNCSKLISNRKTEYSLSIPKNEDSSFIPKTRKKIYYLFNLKNI